MSNHIMKIHLWLIACLLLLINPIYAQESVVSPSGETFRWDSSLTLPDIDGKPHPGLAGAFSGCIGDFLFIAGGANFPDATPWNGGTKTWWNTLYYKNLNDASSAWKEIKGALPSARAYGVSIPLTDGILCIGGCDAKQCYSEVFAIRMHNGKVEIDKNWPKLPVPLANMTGAKLGNKIFLAGGQEQMKPEAATSQFFMLDLSQPKKGWQTLESWPGKARGYAVSAVQNNGSDDCFYLFSGRNYQPDGAMEVLTDGFVYNPRLKQWKKLSGEFPVMAGTALAVGSHHILFLGGVEKLIPGSDTHPGFSHQVLAYHTITNTQTTTAVSEVPIAVTTNLVSHGQTHYITSGEIKPGVRTPIILSFNIQSSEKELGIINWIVIALYFLSLVWIGYHFSKKQKNTEDYFKGGGRIPWWVVGLSIFGTGLSAITFMAIPAKAYASDWSYMMMNAGILMVVPLILCLFIPFFRKLNITTAYEYLEQRFNAPIRIFCSVSFILFQIGRMGIVLYLPAIALNIVTGFDIILCISLMGILSLLYTMVGGIEAVVWTDALQVIVLLGGAILSVIFISMHVNNGFTGIFTEAITEHKFDLGSISFDLRQSTLWTVLIATFFTNLTTYGTDQTMVQRYLTTETEFQARKSVLTNAVLTIPATLIFFFVGTALYVFYKQNPSELNLSITDGDAIFPWYIYSQLPPGITGLLISGIFAAAMSTLSSSMNSAATAYVIDIHSKIRPHEESLITAKIATTILGVLGIAFAYMMATWEITSLWDEFNKILGLILGSMGGLFLLGMLTRRANSIGALFGIIGSIFVQLLFIKTQSIHLLLYTTTGCISCFIIGYLFSLIMPFNKKDITYLTIYNLFNNNK